ncbi:S41 family peptidase [Lutibacter sp. A64]|uniref:S41 family peptidase n=1 Tax=Lutibacter sp. A64 TaxID=2918526 RepID=UPI001F0564A8|nr:S41 family peptidase [Lutibacter sp. A64]UMB54572.1 S41 family peptidase [Lutibacter sp. A64]
MNKINSFIAILLISSIAFVSCNKDDDDISNNFIDTTKIDNQVNHFVWKAMNSWYNWQPNVTNLADTKDDDFDAYYDYLNSYSTPESLFETLLYNKGTTDRFSWFIEDYNEQGASFRGVNDAYGFEFDLTRLCSDCDEVLGYVTYVVPNSPASDAGMQRGDFFYKFDGVELTIDNYGVVNNFYDGEITSISLAFNTLENGVITPNNIEKTLVIREVVENPVLYSDVITNDAGTKIGYLVYNGFKYTFHEELNNVFADFKAEGIQELVLDLRYNGGGSVLTSAYLASMIYGAASENDVFAKLIYNSKHTDEGGYYPFFNSAYVYDKEGDYTNDVTINRLNSLTKLYVITSGSTASASEMIINGLSPYMSVVKIGTTTYGKNVGSITLYDSPDFGEDGASTSHTNALQPIVFQIYNKLDESDYTQGFTPDYEVIEYASQIKPFGNVEEPLLKTALDLISGVSSKSNLASKNLFKTGETIFNSLDKKKYSKEMYIIPQE